MRKVRILSIILIIMTILCIPFFPKNYGSYFPGLLGIYLLLFSYFKNKNRRIYKVLLVLLCYFIVTFSLYSFLSVKSHFNGSNDYDAIIVLGAGLTSDGSVSNTLKYRLDKCIEVYDNTSPIVVSGGQGDDEIISEASAMKTYLVKNGIPEENIVEENKSRTTKENFLFSKELLDKEFSKDYEIAYITNDFHSFRAGFYMRDAGLIGFPIASHTPFYMIPSYFLRDYVSFYKFLIIG